MLAALIQSYAPIGLLLLMMVVAGLGILLASHLIGPHREGEVKGGPYESGMPVIGDARRRFNVKFYIVAMLFLLFDVEVVFMWPWAPLFFKAATQPEHPDVQAMIAQGFGPGFLLIAMAIFTFLLVVGLAYDWMKGVFRWS